MKDEQEDLGKLRKLVPRVDRLENEAKNDLLAITTRMTEMVAIAKKKVDKPDLAHYMYNFGVKLSKTLFDKETHRSGQKGTFENPKRDPDIQALINLHDWQLKLINQDDRELNVDGFFEMLAPQEDEYAYEKIRRAKMMLELESRKIGREITRQQSVKHKMARDYMGGKLEEVDYVTSHYWR